LYASEDGLAFNPLAIYKAIKHLTYDLNDVKRNMEANSYDGKTDIFGCRKQIENWNNSGST